MSDPCTLRTDYDSLAEATHGMLGRLLMLESRVAELERAARKDCVDEPTFGVPPYQHKPPRESGDAEWTAPMLDHAFTRLAAAYRAERDAHLRDLMRLARANSSAEWIYDNERRRCYDATTEGEIERAKEGR